MYRQMSRSRFIIESSMLITESNLFTDLLEETFNAKFIPLSILVENRISWLRDNLFDKLEPIAKMLGEDPTDLFDKLVNIDPTKKKVYTQWIFNMLIKGVSSLSELSSTTDLINKYEELKKSKQLDDKFNNFNVFKSVEELKNAVTVTNDNIKNTNDSIEQKARNESKIIFETGTWLILKPLTEDAAGYFGRETLWCTSAGYGRQETKTNNMFSSYANKGGIIIIYNKKNPKVSYQLSVRNNEFSNGENKFITKTQASEIITQFPALAEYINSDPYIIKFIDKFDINFNDVFDSEKLVYDLSKIDTKEAFKRLSTGIYRKDDKAYFEDIITSDASISASYAIDVLQGEFKKGEDIISTEPYSSIRYAVDALGGAFKQGEEIISKYPSFSYRYAKDALNGRFLLGEKVISEDAEFAYKYAMDILDGKRFIEAEHAIATDEYDMYNFYYARDILKGRFELAEPTMKKEEYIWEEYTKFLDSMGITL